MRRLVFVVATVAGTTILLFGCSPASDDRTASLLPADDAFVQDTVTVAREGSWTISLEPLVVVQDSLRDVVSQRILVRRNGDVLLAPGEDPGSFVVLDSSGKYIRQVGRSGGGPGEYAVVRMIAEGVGDTLHVFDQMQSRITKLAPDYQYAHSVPAPFPPSRPPLVLSNGSYVIPGEFRTPSTLAFPVHLVDPLGAHRLSFGGRSDRVSPETLSERQRSVAPAPRSSGFMVAHHQQYRIDFFDSSGTLVDSLTPAVDWFPSWTGRAGAPIQTERPQPTLLAAIPIEECCVVAVLRVADRNWARMDLRSETESSHRPVEPSGRSPSAMAPQVPLNLLGTLLDTRFELRNVESGELLSSTVVEGSLFPTSTPGVVALARELSTGEHQAMLFRIRVSRNER